MVLFAGIPTVQRSLLGAKMESQQRNHVIEQSVQGEHFLQGLHTDPANMA